MPIAIRRKFLFWLILPALLVIAGIAAIRPGGGSAGLPEKVDFNIHIRPILSDKCFKCHGPDANARKADLRLDIPENAYAELKESPGLYALIPGDPAHSEVYRRVSTQDTSELMPPPTSLLKLTDREIRLIERWISQGAGYKPHWAFIPPEEGALPGVKNKNWPKNDIDYFILNKLEEIGLKPNREAGKEQLLKRLSLDITGLPPDIELQDRFLKDPSPDAYEKMVDELLASPHYGEKMAVSWMDVARYADSHGYQDDGLRTMWPWRDWVIHAFNENYPYDKFVTWQLAGDYLPDPTKEMLLATGFNRNHKITQEGGVIDEEYRLEYVTDRTNTFGKAFLALTFECAKCHDHKYDPISQKDYYSTFAFFNQVEEKGLVGDISLASLADPPNMTITEEDREKILTFINRQDTAPVKVMIMKDLPQVRPTYVLRRGNYDQPADPVSFNLPEAILPFDTTRFAPNRLGLARWLFDEKNPLTARVFVNRVWQEFFGRGIVKTAGDFGMQGELPSHPELLDWLAVEFRKQHWDVKWLVKTLVMSATYRQSSEVNKHHLSIDPENIYLARASRLRLSAELIRDEILAASGLLTDEIGGPSVKPYQPKGIWESSTSGRGQLATYIQDHGDKLYRRGLYNFIKRTVPPPGMLTFDASNRDQCEVKRVRTNTPLQALILLNDPQVLEAARVYAERLTTEGPPPEEQMEKAFRRILCRKARPEEKDLMADYFESEAAEFKNAPEKAEALLKIGEYPRSETADKTAAAAMMQVITLLFNLEEATTRV
ncbi:MAG: PSD1 domain-containing protein [Lewinellaceae bacterium]|nr:PSD1 domain-containing protein [Lewinella sp.]MCB9277508.1 PSD1 domain-containing protein [Lewinellaceae bacterium]